MKSQSRSAGIETYTTKEDTTGTCTVIDNEHPTKNERILILPISYDGKESMVSATDKHTGRCRIGICRFPEKKNTSNEH